MARGVTVNNKRKEEPRNVTLITPHGAEITVSATRAKALLERPGIRFDDQVMRKYALEGEDNVVDDGKRSVTRASAPRTGDRVNTPSAPTSTPVKE